MSSSGRNSLAWLRLLPILIVLLIPVILVLQAILGHTGGSFTLPWDKSYINLSTGKDLAFFGVWGLSKYTFQPAASSLVYPILLVPFFFIAGAYLIIPIIINLIASILLLKTLQRRLDRRGQPLPVQSAVLLLLILLTPLPLLIVSGTEYPLFLLFTALLRDATMASKQQWLVWIYSFLIVATRLEGLVVVTAVCGLLLYRRQTTNAGKVGLAGVLPILIFGLISVSKGGRFIPVAFFQLPDAGLYLAAITGALLILGIMILPLQGRGQWMVYGLLSVFAVIRTTTVLQNAITAAIDTWHQQIPPAQFVHRYYYRGGVTLNQLGAVSWFSEGRKIDLTGRANPLPQLRNKEKIRPRLNIDSLSRRLGARIAIYTGIQPFVRPDNRWDKVASWDVPGNMLSFYALDTAAGRQLRQHMEEYQSMLPEEVQIRYY